VLGSKNAASPAGRFDPTGTSADVPHFVSTPSNPRVIEIADSDNEDPTMVADDDDSDYESQVPASGPPSPAKKGRRAQANQETEATDGMPQFLRWVEKMVIRKDFEKALRLKEASVQAKERELELKEREIALRELQVNKQIEEIKLEQNRVRFEHQKSEEEMAKAKLRIEQGKTAEVRLLEAKTALALALAHQPV